MKAIKGTALAFASVLLAHSPAEASFTATSDGTTGQIGLTLDISFKITSSDQLYMLVMRNAVTAAEQYYNLAPANFSISVNGQTRQVENAYFITWNQYGGLDDMQVGDSYIGFDYGGSFSVGDTVVFHAAMWDLDHYSGANSPFSTDFNGIFFLAGDNGIALSEYGVLIPEPSTAALALGGTMAGLVLLRRRKRA